MGEGHLALKLWEGEGRDLAEAGEEEEAAVGELGVLEGGGGEAAHPQAAQGGRAGPPHHHALVGRDLQEQWRQVCLQIDSCDYLPCIFLWG